MFRKHFPNIAKVMDAWIQNPDDRATASVLLHGLILRKMPDAIPPAMRNSIANSVLDHVEKHLLYGVPPPEKFDVGTNVYDSSGVESTCLRARTGPSSWSIFSAWPNYEGIDQIAVALNGLSVEAWQSGEAMIWRELLRLDSQKREQLREYLTGVINSNHLTRRHCDRECYELPSGD